MEMTRSLITNTTLDINYVHSLVASEQLTLLLLCPYCPLLPFLIYFFSKRTNMSNVDWDTKLVVGKKAKAPVVTRKATDLNGE